VRRFICQRCPALRRPVRDRLRCDRPGWLPWPLVSDGGLLGTVGLLNSGGNATSTWRARYAPWASPAT